MAAGFAAYFAAELESAARRWPRRAGELDDTALQVTAQGWFFVRAIAMVFDRHLRESQANGGSRGSSDRVLGDDQGTRRALDGACATACVRG